MENNNQFIFYIDGGCSGNAQKDMSLRSMISVVTDCFGAVLSEISRPFGSNNIAELYAFTDCLSYISSTEITDCEIYTDSLNTIRWVKSRKPSKKINDIVTVHRLLQEIGELSKKVSYRLYWIKREENLAGHYIENKFYL